MARITKPTPARRRRLACRRKAGVPSPRRSHSSPPEYQLRFLRIKLDPESDAADCNRDWDIVKEAIPALLSRANTSALDVLVLYFLSAEDAMWILRILCQARTRALELRLYYLEFSDALLAEFRRNVALGRVHRLEIANQSVSMLTRFLAPSPPGAGYFNSVGMLLVVQEGDDASAAAEEIRHSVGVYSAAHPFSLCRCSIIVDSPEGTEIPAGLEPSRGLWRMLEIGHSLVSFTFGGDSRDLLTPAHLDVFEECLRERVRAGRELRGFTWGRFLTRVRMRRSYARD